MSACDPKPWPSGRRWDGQFHVRASPQGPAEAHREESAASAQRPWRRGLRCRLSRLPQLLSDYSIHRPPKCAVGKLLTTWLCSGGHGVTSEMRSLYPRSSGPKRGLAKCSIMTCSVIIIRYLQAIKIQKILEVEHILIYPNESLSLSLCVTYKRISVSELLDGDHFPRWLFNCFQHDAIPTIIYCKHQIVMRNLLCLTYPCAMSSTIS